MMLRPRERRLALTAAVLIGCWGLVSWVVQPLWERVRDQGLQVERQAEQLDTLTRLLARQPSIEQAYRRIAGYLEPEDASTQGAFLNELETLSQRARTQLSLKPRPVRPDERMRRFEVELDLEGSQQNLLAFLDALLRMPTLMTLSRLRISSVPATADRLRANVVIQKLSPHPPREARP